MRDIKQVRFEALAAYCRQPGALHAAEEVRWLEAYDEDVLVVVIRDVTDGDYSAMLLARDLKERYRWVEMTKFFDTVEEALAEAPALVEKIHADFGRQRAQGDEKGKPVDFFTPVVATEKLNPDFATISSLEGYSPAIELMKPMMRWYEDADGNFVEQFQTTGFDTRLWELYLFAALVESGYIFDKTFAMPDFCARNAFGDPMRTMWMIRGDAGRLYDEFRDTQSVGIGFAELAGQLKAGVSRDELVAIYQARIPEAKLMMPASAGGRPSNAQPKAARSSFWRTAAHWAMMTTQACRLLAIPPMQHAPAFYRDALMWLLAHKAAASQSGPK